MANDVRLQEGHPVDENLRPLKVGGQSTSLELSKEKARIKNLHVTGIASINQLDVGTVTSGLNVTGAGITVAGISSISTLYFGAGGTVLLVNSEGTVRIGTASTPSSVTVNGGSIPSIGLVIALGG